jgi:hypothetical protein
MKKLSLKKLLVHEKSKKPPIFKSITVVKRKLNVETGERRGKHVYA